VTDGQTDGQIMVTSVAVGAGGIIAFSDAA